METNLFPLQYRCIMLALHFLESLLNLPRDHLTVSALCNTERLALKVAPSWLSDLEYALCTLQVDPPEPISFDYRSPLVVEKAHTGGAEPFLGTSNCP